MKRRLFLGLVITLLTLFLAAAESTPPATAQSSNFEAAACGFYVPVGLPVDCGYLTVPADRNNPEAGTMRLHVSHYSSFADRPLADPVIYVMGGPGGGPGSNESSVLHLGVDVDFAIFLERRDFIVLDQRGAGYSEPALDCRAMTSLSVSNAQEDLNASDYMERQQEALRACFAEYADAGIQLDSFSTANTAADLEDLRLALGIETWNVYGLGYGSRAALAYAAAHPESTRSLILSSPIPPDETWAANAPRRVDASLQALFESCANDLECATDYPNLEDSFFRAIETLRDNPYVTTAAHPVTQTPITLVIDDLRFIDTVRWGLLFADNIQFMPFVIDAASQGSFQFVRILNEQLIGNPRYVSEGTQYAMLCREEWDAAARTTSQDTLSEAPDALRDYLSIELGLGASICAELDLDPLSLTMIPTEVPTLIYGGLYDNISPPAYVEALAASLPGSQSIVFPGLSYDALYSWDTCPQLVTGDFLENPAAPLTTACLDDPDRVNFISRADMRRLQESYTTD